MLMTDYAAMMSRITPHGADDIDDVTARFEGRAAGRGRDVFPTLEGAPKPQPNFKRGDAICVGFRVTGEMPDAAERAMRLAALALERDVEVILLSEDGLSGFERFGFRVERVPAAGQRDDWTDQVRRFWGLDHVF